jgi:hypothetical protein
MAQAPESVIADAEQVYFELERFELASGDRLELSGRWYGVRGRRFVRPTLMLIGDGQRSRALADLEHKPWSAEDGESWIAAFPCELDGGEVLEVELAVAPDIAVTLSPPESLRKRAGKGTGGKRRRALQSSSGSEPAAGELVALRRELAVVRQTIEDEQLRTSQLQHELEHAGLAKAEVTATLSRRDAAVSKLDAVLAERDQAFRERDAARREGEAARRDLEEARRAGEAARAERDQAVHERASMARACKRMSAVRDEALSARDDALARLQRVEAATRTQLAELRDQFERERAELERPAQLPPLESSPPEPIPSRPRLRYRRSGSFRRVESDWLRRSLALIVLLTAVIALAIVLHSP